MKKITLSIGLIASVLCSNAQDTSKIAIKGNTVFEWNYKTGHLIREYKYKKSFFTQINENNVLNLWLYDKIDRNRVVITTYPNGKTSIDTLKSKDNMYFSKLGPFRIEIKE